MVANTCTSSYRDPMWRKAYFVSCLPGEEVFVSGLDTLEFSEQDTFVRNGAWLFSGNATVNYYCTGGPDDPKQRPRGGAWSTEEQGLGYHRVRCAPHATI